MRVYELSVNRATLTSQSERTNRARSGRPGRHHTNVFSARFRFPRRHRPPVGNVRRSRTRRFLCVTETMRLGSVVLSAIIWSAAFEMLTTEPFHDHGNRHGYRRRRLFAGRRSNNGYARYRGQDQQPPSSLSLRTDDGDDEDAFELDKPREYRTDSERVCPIRWVVYVGRPTCFVFLPAGNFLIFP